MIDSLQSIFTLDTLLTTLRLAIPIALAAVGVTICERAGVLNLGVEGMMLLGAVSAVVGSHFTGNPWIGVLSAIAIGGLTGLLHGVLSLRFHGNQTVSGVGINLMASGLTVVICKAIWGNDGMSGQVAQIQTIDVPLLCRIPVLGRFFQGQSPFLYISILLVLVIWYGFYKTFFGLRLRAIGDNPMAVQSVGINVNQYRYVVVVLSGMLAGLGGAYLSIVQNNLFVSEMVAGRGFLAIASNIFGGWDPLGAALASLLFAFAQALRLNLADLNIPDQFIQMLPYAITLLVLIVVGSRRKAKGPEALGTLVD